MCIKIADWSGNKDTAMPPTLPTYALLREIFQDEAHCTAFLFQNGVYYNNPICPNCQNPLKVYENRGVFSCRRRPCNASFSIRIHTLFHKHHLPSCKILELGYFWLQKVPVTSV